MYVHPPKTLGNKDELDADFFYRLTYDKESQPERPSQGGRRARCAIFALAAAAGFAAALSLSKRHEAQGASNAQILLGMLVC